MSKKIRYSPTKSQIIKDIKNQKPRIYYDSLGRLYGTLDDDNELIVNIRENGFFQSAMWVYLPRKQLTLKGPSNYLLTDETLDFPEDHAEIPLKNYYNDQEELVIKIHNYPEDIRRRVITSIVIEQ